MICQMDDSSPSYDHISCVKVKVKVNVNKVKRAANAARVSGEVRAYKACVKEVET